MVSVLVAAPGRIAIPRSSVLEERGANHVFLVRDGRALRVPVELGEEQRGRVEVRSGLSPGDRYVLQPPPGLADGARVSEVER